MKTFTINKTHISKIRTRNSIQMDEVCNLLNWTAEQYCWHQYRQYEKFCNSLAAESPDLCKRLRYSDVFRGFWNNEWAKRNEVDFLPFAWDSIYDIDPLGEEYLFINDAIRLIHDEEFYNRFENLLKLI